MLSRPLDRDELEAIADFLAKRGATQCPPTGRGEPLPYVNTGRNLAQLIAASCRLAQLKAVGRAKAA